MGGWSISLAICALICLGLGVGGRLDAHATGWLYLGALLFLCLSVTVHVSAIVLREHRRRGADRRL